MSDQVKVVELELDDIVCIHTGKLPYKQAKSYLKSISPMFTHKLGFPSLYALREGEQITIIRRKNADTLPKWEPPVKKDENVLTDQE